MAEDPRDGRSPGGARRTGSLLAAVSGLDRFGRGGRLGGRYRMGALLASGGMGEVWAAHDLLLDRAVAVKLLGGALAGDGRAAERLRREARAAGRLEHPNVARVLDLGEQDGRPYLVMELLEGESLAARVARGPMAPAEAAGIVAAVADALQAAHRAGIVHRDVKPGNVFLTVGGQVKVLDFGIASAAGDAALTTGVLLGTAAYLAPERVLGHPATPAADVYALGVVLYELLAGRRPFEARSEVELAMAHVHASPDPLDRIAPQAPPFLVAACHQALAKDPAARPPSAAAFAHLLRPPDPAAATTRPFPVASTAPLPVAPTRPLPVAATTGRTAVPPCRGRRASRSPRRGVLVALLLVAAVLAALPALGNGLARLDERIEVPFAVQVPDLATPGGQDAGQDPAGADVPPQTATPPADRGDDDRRDDDSSGSGRSGGGGDSGGGGSSGPG